MQASVRIGAVEDPGAKEDSAYKRCAIVPTDSRPPALR
jgi:hypothetical protein